MILQPAIVAIFAIVCFGLVDNRLKLLRKVLTAPSSASSCLSRSGSPNRIHSPLLHTLLLNPSRHASYLTRQSMRGCTGA